MPWPVSSRHRDRPRGNTLGLQLLPAAVKLDGDWTFGWFAGLTFETIFSASGGGPL